MNAAKDDVFLINEGQADRIGALKRQLPALQRKPPSCVRGYTCRAPKDLASYIGNHISNTCVYGYQCACGNGVFHIGGYGIEGVTLTDRITLRCCECGEEHMVFDGSMHGYDGALGLAEGVGFHDPELSVVCPQCKGNSFAPALGFEHTVDPDEAKEAIKEANAKAKREDLFTWLIGAARCTACNHIFTFADIECA